MPLRLTQQYCTLKSSGIWCYAFILFLHGCSSWTARPWRWRLSVSSKYQKILAQHHSVTSHKKWILIFFPIVLWPDTGHGILLLEVSRSHTMMHHSREDSSGRVISPSQRPLPDNKQHSQETHIRAPSRIRTHNPSNRVAADMCLRPRGHWGQPESTNNLEIHEQYRTAPVSWCIWITSSWSATGSARLKQKFC